MFLFKGAVSNKWAISILKHNSIGTSKYTNNDAA